MHSYRHGVIPDLISSDLLRNVRTEVQNLSFTPKETDIYRIHQSGDLANLDGLDDDSLKRLPSLLTLRNAMYSSDFRSYLSTVTGSGPLSGRRTDMAINIYTPGCHLLCHDDVIGSRRVSYILYLTDPEQPWREDWGGALRLYPTKNHIEKDGEVTKVPSPDHTVSISPAFNQLSFFAVQPGESFHDVEEVYAERNGSTKSKGEDRIRMAISGWFHIPQAGEDDYEEDLEQRLAEKSSLMQLQGKQDQYELPQSRPQLYSEPTIESGMPTPSSQEDPLLTEEDCNLLLKFIAPTYLTPDTLESVSSIFAEECSVCLDTFLSPNFSAQIENYIRTQEQQPLPSITTDIEETTTWNVARPPHKHRFLFQQLDDENAAGRETSTPLDDLFQELLPSKTFQKWLSLATGLQVSSHDTLLRRFRRGHDYTLATAYEADSPRIELCLALTPSTRKRIEPDDTSKPVNAADETINEDKPSTETEDADENDTTGGYLAYMAGDEDADDIGSDAGSDHGVEVPLDMSTGARASRAKKPKLDPAIYQSNDDDEDDGVLFSMPADWNRLGIVLRDKGTMRFVKYVSRMAKGDRWDIVGEFDVVDEDENEDEDEDRDEGDNGHSQNNAKQSQHLEDTDDNDVESAISDDESDD